MGFFNKWFGPRTLEADLNEQSAKELGWGPAWFGAEKFDDVLEFNVRNYQKSSGIESTGIVDVSTYRRRLAELQNNTAEEEIIEGKSIICGDEKIPIRWKKVITHLNEQGLELPKTHYRPVINFRTPRMFMVHWDVSLSSINTYKILMKRGISVHFAIDNDGTIHQWMDAEDIAYHAGNRIVNNRSIGVEIANAYYLKYQKYYENKGFGSRPVWMNKRVHGRTLDPFLGFYPVQMEALKALIEAIHRAYPTISLDFPKDRTGQMTSGVYPDAKKGKFSGIVNHYHITERKIDCAGAPIDDIVRQLHEEKEQSLIV
jgi:hypothetical protein